MGTSTFKCMHMVKVVTVVDFKTLVHSLEGATELKFAPLCSS